MKKLGGNVIKRRMTAVALAATGLIWLGAMPAARADEDGGSWKFSGGNIHNTRGTTDDSRLSPSTTHLLKTKWVFTTTGDVSSTPTVEGNAVYVSDWGGSLYRINAETGQAVWSHKISDYTGNPKSLSRNSPAIGEKAIIIGDQAGGTVIAVDKHTGALLWKTSVDPNPYALMTSSAVISGNVIYVGVSSGEEGAATNPAYTPTFRGSVVALDVRTGKIIWQFYVVPQGYTGGAVWSSNFAVDHKRNSLYVTTGNNYTTPPAVVACVAAAGSSVPAQIACLAPDDYIDAIMSLDLDTGHPKWARRLQGADSWNVACLFGAKPPCPSPAGPDYDFGTAPNLFHVSGDAYSEHSDPYDHDRDRRGYDVVGAGQKSGIYWALNPDNGDTIWARQVGPGGVSGGIEWGAAADGKRVYVPIANNSYHTTYTLAGGKVWNAGSWAALDAKTGNILWQIPVTGQDPTKPTFGAGGLGSVSVANDVMFAPSMSGDMVAIDARTGAIRWTFASGGSVLDGPSIVDETVYWGSGYAHFGLGSPNNKVFAFTLP